MRAMVMRIAVLPARRLSANLPAVATHGKKLTV